jgi:hypothetical protein
MNRGYRIVAGTLIGAVVALVAAAAIATAFTSLAAETNATVVKQFEGKRNARGELQALQALHLRIAREGGLRGFLAKRIHANNGLGYSHVNKPAMRIWVESALVGAAIGATAGAIEAGSILVIVAEYAYGVGSKSSPVANTTVFVGGAISGVIVLAALTALRGLLARPKAREARTAERADGTASKKT